MALQNRQAFYASVESAELFGRALCTSQSDGLSTLVEAMRGQPLAFASYDLATAFHETSRTMQPVRERGSSAYLERYDTGKLAHDLGNTPEKDGDGARYAGRGYVQLTGHANYERIGKLLGMDLISNPDAALVPATAALILMRGMADGWFTGKRLSDYLPVARPGWLAEFVQARRVVNGTDCANQIAGYAVAFQSALVDGGWLERS